MIQIRCHIVEMKFADIESIRIKDKRRKSYLDNFLSKIFKESIIKKTEKSEKTLKHYKK